MGCATGFVVEVLRELGVEAEGCDVSRFAVDNASPGAKGHLRLADLMTGLPWPDRTFDLVSVLETLEHLPPDQVGQAISEVVRVCGGFVYATTRRSGRTGVRGPTGSSTTRCVMSVSTTTGLLLLPMTDRFPSRTWQQMWMDVRSKAISRSRPIDGGRTNSKVPGWPGGLTSKPASRQT